MKTIIIVTGMSGAGKTTVMKSLEDTGFYCIDNLPPALIPKFAEMSNGFEGLPKEVAFGIDIRDYHMLEDLASSIDYLKGLDIHFKLVFLDATDAVLVKRYNETRRRHPLHAVYNDTLDRLFTKERVILTETKSNADYVIDTTFLTSKQLKHEINKIMFDGNADSIVVNVSSFGFKYGMPTTADLVFDVRCLPNPFYIEELKHKTGLDQEVRDYVYSFEESRVLLDKIVDLINFSLPLYEKEGKSQLEIVIGCTGGKHRSVSFVENIIKRVSHKNLTIHKLHRDIEK